MGDILPRRGGPFPFKCAVAHYCGQPGKMAKFQIATRLVGTIKKMPIANPAKCSYCRVYRPKFPEKRKEKPVELKEFIRETLAQIAAGVEAPQTEVRDAGGFVNTAHRTGTQEQDKSHFGSLASGQNIFLVNFDVTVTVIDATETEGKAKLNVAGLLNLGTGGQSNASSTATNRICFKVPLAMPVDTVSREELQREDQERAERRRRQTEQIRASNLRNSTGW